MQLRSRVVLTIQQITENFENLCETRTSLTHTAAAAHATSSEILHTPLPDLLCFLRSDSLGHSRDSTRGFAPVHSFLALLIALRAILYQEPHELQPPLLRDNVSLHLREFPLGSVALSASLQRLLWGCFPAADIPGNVDAHRNAFYNGLARRHPYFDPALRRPVPGPATIFTPQAVFAAIADRPHRAPDQGSSAF